MPAMIDHNRERVKIIWGAEAIAHKLGCSADFVRDKLAREEGTPVLKRGGRWCAIESDLIAYFKGRPA